MQLGTKKPDVYTPHWTGDKCPWCPKESTSKIQGKQSTSYLITVRWPTDRNITESDNFKLKIELAERKKANN